MICYLLSRVADTPFRSRLLTLLSTSNQLSHMKNCSWSCKPVVLVGNYYPWSWIFCTVALK